MNSNRAAAYAATLVARLTAAATARRAQVKAEAVRVERAYAEAERHAQGMAWINAQQADRDAASIRRVRASLALDMPARRPVR